MSYNYKTRKIALFMVSKAGYRPLFQVARGGGLSFIDVV
jgi:hypothetical protein